MAKSLAIASDAAHLLTDIASFMISLFAIWLAKRPPSTTMNFGWHRAEILGAILSTLMIWVITGKILFEGYLFAGRISEPKYWFFSFLFKRRPLSRQGRPTGIRITGSASSAPGARVG